MINFDFNSFCTGCSACAEVCKFNAIIMERNNEGFLIPNVDLKKCISCGKCELVCPHLNTKANSRIKPLKSCIYASPDKKNILESASGGAFYDIASQFLTNDGFVCGCSWDNNLIAKHILVDNINDLSKLQGSKYVQSEIGNIYGEIVEKLSEGNRVLFSGTPCQCNALNNIVCQCKNEIKNNLYLISIVCHGVPSPLAFESYKRWIEKKYGHKLVNINFRDKKKYGYKKQMVCHTLSNGKTIYTPSYLPTSKFMESSIVYNLTLRNSCFSCECKDGNTSSDLIIGDWFDGCDKYNNGSSCIVVLSRKGEQLINNLSISNLSFDEILSRNKMIIDSTNKNKNRDLVISNIMDYSIWDKIEKYYSKKYFLKRLFIKTGIYRIFKK